MNYNIEKDGDVSPDVLDLLNKEYNTPEYTPTDFTKLENLMELIHEAGNYKERLDSNYLYKDYSLVIGDYVLETTYSQYRKDGGLCPGEWDDSIYIRKK